MANTVFKLRRSSVAGKVPTTSDIAIGELAVNLTDRKLYSSDGTNTWTIGSNLSNLSVTANASIANLTVSANTTVNNLIVTGGLFANGSDGAEGQVLTSNGSAVYWAAASGGGGVLEVREQFTANGSQTDFSVDGGYVANAISVYLNGVLLRNGVEANVESGTAVVISPAPANGSLIDVVGISSVYSTGVSATVSQQFTANGSSNNFVVSGGYIPSQIQVYLNGVKQIPGTDVIITSGSNVVFTVAPSNGYIVDVFGYQGATVLDGKFTLGEVVLSNNNISVGNSSVNTQIVAGNVYLNGSTLVIGNTETNVTINSASITIGGVSVNTTSFSGTSNNTLFVGSTSAANVVSNTQLSSNLSNYAALAGATFTGDVSINANLIVSGTTVTVNVATLDVKDKNITVAKGSGGGSAANGAGLTVDGTSASFYWDSTANSWSSNVGLNVLNGNVGIGTSTPTYKLYVSDTIYVAGELRSDTTTPGVRLYSGGSEKGKVSANSTGYLLFDTVGTQRMCIDGDGNTSIGTSTTSNGRLQVENNGTNFVWARNSAAGAGISGFVCQNSGDTRGIRIDGSNFQVYDHSAGAVRMQIDGSGRVTKPNQPFGFVTWTGNMGRGNYIVFNSKNQSATDYSTSTGRMTAPVAGVYQFNCAVRTLGAAGSNFSISFVHNGNFVIDLYGYDTNNGKRYGVNLSALRYLSAGDYVQFYYNHDTGGDTMDGAWMSYELLS